MSRRDEAVGAGATAILSRPIDAAGSVAGEAEADARVAIDAALAVLHPTVPNDVDALDRLPVGTVLRGVDQDGTAWLLHPQESFCAAGAVLYSEAVGVDEWQVIYQPEEKR